MRIRWNVVVWWAFGLLCCCQPLLAEEKWSGDPWPFERVLARSREMDALELWDRMLGADFDLSSLPGCRRGFFEFFVAIPHGDQGVGWANELCDDNGNARIVVAVGSERLPKRIGIDQVGIVLVESLAWERREPVRWGFVVDGDHLQFRSNPDENPPGYDGFIRFHLNSYLARIMEPEIPEATWSRATRALSARKSNGTTAHLRFRTPHDQRRFGTVLGSVFLRSSNGIPVLFRSFIVDCESPLRLNISDPKNLAERLGAEEQTEVPEQPIQLLKGEAEMQAAAALQEQIPPLECRDERPMQQPEFRTRFREMINKMNVLAEREIYPQLEANKHQPLLDPFVDAMVQELEIAYSSIEAAITAGTDDPIVDDSDLMWLGFERALNPREATVTFENVLRNVLKAESVPLYQKVRICTAMGEMGCPAWAVAGFPLLGPDGPFLEAILHARWGWVPTEEQIALCHEKRNEEWAGALAREAAIDSLIRWGKLDEIPAEQMDDWFQSKLAASETHRHCTWKALTRTDSGRRFLMDRLESLEAQPEIRRDIANILCLRASAALDMQRFDFMTEQECQLTLRTCQPLVH